MLLQFGFHSREIVGMIQLSQVETSYSHSIIDMWEVSNMAGLKELVERKLAEHERNAFEAARIGGLDRYFVHDILIDKKTNVVGGNVGKLATAIGATPAEVVAAMGRSSKSARAATASEVNSDANYGESENDEQASAEKIFSKLPDETQRFALEFLEFLAQRSEGNPAPRLGKRGRGGPTKSGT